MKVLITGITGFVGSHLAEHLLTKPGVEVIGLRRWRSPLENIKSILGRIKLYECDLKDPVGVRKMLEDIRPEQIYHLAAQSFVPTSWRLPMETLNNNILGQANLLEAVRELGLKPRVLLTGSSEEYGMALESELPIKETNPLRPLSPYAVSKIAQDMMGYQYFKTYQMSIVRTRAFNHTGPRRGLVFATSNFAAQIAAIEKGLQEPVLRVGNLTTKRDFTDVRDMARAYSLALEKGEPGEVYNICTGKSMAIQEVLNMLLKMTDKKISVAQDPARMRPSDVFILQGDNTKFCQRTGWKPEIKFEKTLEDLLNYWRERVSAHDFIL